MRQYEAMLILQPELEDEDVNGVVEQVGEIVTRDGGKVTKTGQLVDKKGNISEVSEETGWTARRLAYPINLIRDAYYAVLQFDAPTDTVENIEQSLRLNEDVLRFLVVRIEVPGEEG